MSLTLRRTFFLLLGPLLFVGVLLWLHPEGMTEEARAVLAVTAWIAVWWITEPVPIPATSLLPLVLFPLTEAVPKGSTASAYGDDIIFLFLGGFVLALAMEKWNLHRRIALTIVSAVGTQPRRVVLGFMLATGFLSCWISNTATAMMMTPIGLAVISQLKNYWGSGEEGSRFARALLLGIAYGASIGGLGTIIGTPGNAILAGMVQRFFRVEITFAQWLLFGMPLAALLLLFCWAYLVRVAFPLAQRGLAQAGQEIRREKAALGAMSPEERRVFWVFVGMAAAWISRTFLLAKLFPGINDTVIAIGGACVLFLIPAPSTKNAADPSTPSDRLLDWSDASALPWGILLLFGGGLAIADGFQQTGLADWLGTRLTVLEGIPFLLILLTVTLMVNFLTEITSNVATATMILPVMAALSQAIGVHPYGLMIGACVASSCAFMLPVATPPNAIVFASGHIRMQDMVRAGIWLNLASVLLIVALIYLLLPVVWNLDLLQYPNAFRSVQGGQ
ncbi:solute carrier family 13 (sodium-dependent dicarboxylate transporter), member 2/3/5 [Catalinimonas alkaloidigena]|uniref:Solute carrier family 13 (Sodium-dependent dicarboxylate transporter), member 2/3/5 n=1 Tax=Catalinimonas alkaloidigena TaxID=1075417 RepID=A0A1G9H737_9BACT|nr:DASS family sodium-coupled anion symporter [Catalinimonas alkaloidigena]SDL08818.1 solute carrier family 13 (sodium-dependent dicarboxylate transporter), member 2/3/5 [Catalinimonas alkaloidigena]